MSIDTDVKRFRDELNVELKVIIFSSAYIIYLNLHPKLEKHLFKRQRWPFLTIFG